MSDCRFGVSPVNYPDPERRYVLFVLVNCLGGLRMPENSVCRLTVRVRHDINSVYLAVKRQNPYIF